MDNTLEMRIDNIEKMMRRNRRFTVLLIVIGVCAIVMICEDEKRKNS